MALTPGVLIDGDYQLTKSSTEAKRAAAPPPPVDRRVPTKPAPPKTSPKPKPKVTPKPKPKVTPKSAPRVAATGSGGSSGGAAGGSSGIKNSSDKAQVAALNELLKSGFAKARDTKIGNLQKVYNQQDKDVVTGYLARIKALQGNRLDNERSEADSSFANLSNRAREATDLLMQAANVGAGETDLLKSRLMAVRNWDANQADVNRSFYDTQRSVNSAMADLNADTRTARMNLAAEALGDQEQIWANYYNQRADAWTQLGNIEANPYSDSHNAKGTAYANVAKEAASSWKNPGINDSLQKWQGTIQPVETKLNNQAIKNADTQPAIKRPEGSTLRKW